MTDPYTEEAADAADVRVTLSEAVDAMTVGEVGLIERHYGKNFNDLSGISLTAGLIWAMERRSPLGEKKFDWADVNAFTMRRVNDYFADEPPDLDPDAPDSDSGKDV